MTRQRRGSLLFDVLINNQESLVNNEAINMLMSQNYFSYFPKVEVTEQLQKYITRLTG